MDPTKWLNTPDQTRIGALYDQLVALGSDGNPEMQLATDFTPNADGTEWTVVLRPGVTFHDGSPLSSKDVMYSLKRVMDSGAVASATLSSIDFDRSEAVDDGTIVFRLNRPAGDFPSFFVDPPPRSSSQEPLSSRIRSAQVRSSSSPGHGVTAASLSAMTTTGEPRRTWTNSSSCP